MNDEQSRALYAQVAEKIKIEKEVQTAEIVQRSFFPRVSLDRPGLRVAGHTVPATQCSGDWWQYAIVGDHVVVVVGDVLGHGVAAALVTAAIQCAFVIFNAEARSGGTPSLQRLSQFLDVAVKVGGADSATMSLFCVSIDMKAQTLTYLNHAHCKPFLLDPHATHLLQGVRVLSHAMAPHLGTLREEDALVTQTIPYRPGELLFLYTDGYFDNLRNSQERSRRAPVLKRIMQMSAIEGASAEMIVNELKNWALQGIHNGQEELIDDLTTVICEFPRT